MRIEYSSLATQKMGFEYRYPLLHPKLLEFYLSLPRTQKISQGLGRYLMRRYLGAHLPDNIFNRYKKRDGLGILPATLALFAREFESGTFRHEFQSLPFLDKLDHSPPRISLIHHIQAYMLNEYLTSLQTCPDLTGHIT